MKNPWLEKSSKPYSVTKYFIIDEVKNYNSNEFYIEFLEVNNEQITELTIDDLKTYENGKVQDVQQNLKGNKLYIQKTPDSISFNLMTKLYNNELIVITNVPKYGGRFFYGETDYNAKTIESIKKLERGDEVYKLYENPHLVLDSSSFKHKAIYWSIINRCNNSHTSKINYLDKNEKVFKIVRKISINN